MGDFMFCRRLAKGRGRSSSLARPRHERADDGAGAHSFPCARLRLIEMNAERIFMVHLYGAPRSSLAFERRAALSRNAIAFDAVHFHGGQIGAPLRGMV